MTERTSWGRSKSQTPERTFLAYIRSLSFRLTQSIHASSARSPSDSHQAQNRSLAIFHLKAGQGSFKSRNASLREKLLGVYSPTLPLRHDFESRVRHDFIGVRLPTTLRSYATSRVARVPPRSQNTNLSPGSSISSFTALSALSLRLGLACSRRPSRLTSVLARPSSLW